VPMNCQSSVNIIAFILHDLTINKLLRPVFYMTISPFERWELTHTTHTLTNYVINCCNKILFDYYRKMWRHIKRVCTMYAQCPCFYCDFI